MHGNTYCLKEDFCAMTGMKTRIKPACVMGIHGINQAANRSAILSNHIKSTSQSTSQPAERMSLLLPQNITLPWLNAATDDDSWDLPCFIIVTTGLHPYFCWQKRGCKRQWTLESCTSTVIMFCSPDFLGDVVPDCLTRIPHLNAHRSKK